MRFLGVDYGDSYTGLAISDPLGITCSPLSVVCERDESRLIASIVAEVARLHVERIVVGVPRPLSGGVNEQKETVLKFVGHLELEAPVPVCTWDERFTSKLAGRHRGRGERDDAVAACYMLQDYLNTLTINTGSE